MDILGVLDEKHQQIAGLTAQLRERARQHGPYVSTTAIVGACWPRVHVSGDDLAETLRGFARIEGKHIYVYYARGLEPGEQREVIGHELGHLALERLSSGARRECAIVLPSDSPIEGECNLFSDELLAPILPLDRDVPTGITDLAPRSKHAETAWRNWIDHEANRRRVSVPMMTRRIALLTRARALRAVDEQRARVTEEERRLAELERAAELGQPVLVPRRAMAPGKGRTAKERKVG